MGAVVYTEDLLPKKRNKMFNSGNFVGRHEGVEIAFWCKYQVFLGIKNDQEWRYCEDCGMRGCVIICIYIFEISAFLDCVVNYEK